MSQSLEKVCKDLEIASKELKLSLQKTRAESKRVSKKVSGGTTIKSPVATN